MARLRDIVLFLAPQRLRTAMEAETREWIVECDTGHGKRNLRDLGGLRYKASGRPTIRVTCSVCGTRRTMTLHRPG